MRVWLRATLALVVLLGGCRAPPADAPVADVLVRRGESAYFAGEIDSARSLWRTALEAGAGDPTLEPRVLTWLGLAAYRQGEYGEARDLGERALRLKEARGLESEVARSHIALGLLAWNEGRLDDALEHYRHAAEGGRRFQNDSILGRAAVNLGLVHADLGELEEARSRIAEGRMVAERLDDDRLAGGALANLGMVELWAGAPAAAVVWLDSARLVYRRIGYRTGEENVVGQLGAAYAALGEPGRALAALDTAIAIAREQGLRREEAENLELQAGILHEAGDPGRGLRLLVAAEAVYRELELPDERGNALRRRATMRAELGDFVAALVLADSALAAHVEAEARLGQLEDRLLLAELHREAGSRAGIRRHLDSAARLTASIGTPAARLSLALTRARLHLADGDAPAALAALSPDPADAARLASAAAWEPHALRARAYERMDRLDSAAAAGEAALAQVERIRDAHVSDVLRTTFTSRRSDVYADLALIRLRQGRVEDAFAVADAARGRALLERLAALRGQLAGEAVRELRESERLLRRIDALAARLEEASEPGGERGRGETDGLERRLQQARSEYEARLVRAADRDPRGASLLGARRVEAADVRAALRQGELLVEYLVTPRRLVIFVVTPSQTRVLQQPIAAAELAARVRLVRDLVARPDLDTAASLAASEALHDELIGPIERAGLLAGVRTLILVPHEALTYLAFAALRHPLRQRYLVDDYAIWTTPTAAALPVQRAGSAPPALLAPAKLERSTVLAPFPERLTASGPETRGAARVLGTRRLVIGAAATERRIRHAFARGDIVHVATHGLLNPRNPFFSRIELARPRRGRWRSADDGRLELHELLEIPIRSPLVVLSGCETGLGRAWSTDFLRGDDYATLAQAMLFSGAGGVIATLWRVDDAGAAALAERFYHHLRTRPPAAALAAAQREVRRDPRWASPYHWAGYRLNGEGLRTTLAKD